MAKKRKKSSSKQVKRVDDNDQESSEEEEEAPVPQRLVAFAVFFLIMLVLVTGYFQMHPKDRFPDQWQTTNLDPDAEYTDNLAQPEQEMDFRPDFWFGDDWNKN